MNNLRQVDTSLATPQGTNNPQNDVPEKIKQFESNEYIFK